MRGRDRAGGGGVGDVPGELVVLATGLHESPGGRGEHLALAAQEHGFTADAVVVCELGGDSFIAAHLGCATVEITVSRPGPATHELKTPVGTPTRSSPPAR